jgi:tRNA-2-methylthio-N6-dimethylallyladenosine synthase
LPDQTYYLYTFGCQMNEHDSEVTAGLLEGMGYSRAGDPGGADLVVVNTCCVRGSAEHKVFSLLGRLAGKGLVAVGGCLAQREGMAGEIRRRFPAVRLIFGPHALPRLPELVTRAAAGETVVAVEEAAGAPEEGLPARRAPGVRAWVPITFGCNNFCTYCVVPLVRGRERSRPPEAVVAEVERLGREGYREVTLLGPNVNSYGRDLGTGLARLLERLDGPVSRLRFLTSHPRDLDDRLIETVAALPRVCEHFHLPAQSGSDRVLKLMHRGYTRTHYLDLVRRIRLAMPEAAVTTDLIVGFPQETGEDFEATLALVEEAGFDAAYTFVYNARPGTPAAAMEGQVSAGLKKERIAALVELVNRIALARNQARVGAVEEVLVESASGPLFGRTRGNRAVTFPGGSAWVGELVPVRIVRATPRALEGEVAG